MTGLARAAALLALLSVPARAQQAVDIKRGDLRVVVRIKGTVVTTEMIRLKAQIEGRVEKLNNSTYTWATNNTPVAYLASKEMAAILDSHTTTVHEAIEDRWRKVYQPTPIRCPSDCFVTRMFAKPREWLKPRALLFEAALKVQLIGRVRPEDAHWIKDGQTLEYWAVDNPSKKLRARVSRYVLDIQGEKQEPGGTFTINLTPDSYLDPGTEWEGTIVPVVRRDVLIAPTQALIYHKGSVYLPIRVSTGVTTSEFTEITAGADAKRPVLVLDDSKLGGEATRYVPAVEYDALRRRVRKELDEREGQATERPQRSDRPANSVPDEPRASRARDKTEKAPQLPDPDATYSESPYGE
jgi:hypothetical protein